MGTIERKKLGSNLGPIAAENRVKPRSETQNQAKRINEIVFLWMLRDRGSEVQILSPRPIYPGVQPGDMGYRVYRLHG